MRGVEQIPFLYDLMMAMLEWTGMRSWRVWLAGAARGRTLDLGCGTGRNLPLFGAGCTPIGLDPSAEALAKARRRAPAVPLVRGSAHHLPFRSGAFDTVVSGLVFCSVPDVPRGLAEVKRVLGEGGRLKMLEHVRSSSRWGARWQDFIQPAWTCVAGGCHPNRATEAAVEAAGFEIETEGRRSQANLRRFSAKPPA